MAGWCLVKVVCQRMQDNSGLEIRMEQTGALQDQGNSRDHD